VDSVDVAVVGAGQAGLATSWELAARGVEHVVLERDTVGSTWAGRWDSFCLVTPNWGLRLPGHPYDGPDPDGFLPRDDIVAHLSGYAAVTGAPVRQGMAVEQVTAAPGGGFVLHTPGGALRARAVVACSGPYAIEHRPAAAASLPPDLAQLAVPDYRNPAALPPGAVLVVGSGQSGAQIAEELHEAGREVVLACGRVPWAPRRVGGRDIFWWALETGFMSQPVSALPSLAARLWGNISASGHGGGHDLHLRTLRTMGVTLAGHFLGAEGHLARFADDLGASAAWGDERYLQLAGLMRALVAARGLDPIDPPAPGPFDPEAPTSLSLRGFGAVIFAGGFRPGYHTWLPWPEAFDADGFPLQVDGTSTVIDGLYFVGGHFQRTRKSAVIAGVGEDAAIVAATIAATIATRT
jgi:putative flavoprotein involved in K+ transport